MKDRAFLDSNIRLVRKLVVSSQVSDFSQAKPYEKSSQVLEAVLKLKFPNSSILVYCFDESDDRKHGIAVAKAENCLLPYPIGYIIKT